MKFFIFTVAIYLTLIVLSFGNLPQTFFQQDEWAIFGNYLYWDKAHLSIFQRLFVYEQYTHLVPFSNAFSYIQFTLFGLNFAPYSLVSLLLHVINALLVLSLVNILLKKRFLGALAGGLFLINSISHQAVTWIATAPGTVGSTTVLLMSLVLYAKYLTHQGRKSWYLWLSLLLFLISLGFKETSIFAFVFFPFFGWQFMPKRTFKTLFRLTIPIGILGVAYVFIRLFFSIFIISSPSIPAELTQPSIPVYLFRLIAIPVRVLAQSFMPIPFILKASRELVKLAYPHFAIDNTPDPYLVESVAADILSFFIFSIILFTRVILRSYWQRLKAANTARLFDVSLVFIALSALPFVVIPGAAGYLALLDGRHLYLTGTFSAILLAIVLDAAWSKFNRKTFILFIVLALLGLFSTYHVLKVRRDISYQMALGQLRQSILHKISDTYPTLPQKAVFYITSDAPYYGLPYEEPIVPFQSGFGQTLLVWYNARIDDLPACLFEHQYLYVLLSEDYKECGGRGFGYFRKPESFNQAIKKYELDPNNVIAFRFSSSTNSLLDVTEETREIIRRLGKL